MKRKYKEKDFTRNELPHNRWQVFLDIIKLHWRTILFLGIMLLIFSLPLYGFSLYIDWQKAVIASKYNEGLIDLEACKSSIKSFEFIFIVVLPICLIILSIGLSGIIRIIKRLCYLEPIFLLDDFKKGIKQNTKLYALTFLLFSLINFVVTYIYKSFENIFISYIPLGLAITLVYPVMIIMLVVISTYDVTLPEAISNSYKIYFRSFFLILLISVVLCSPIFFNFISDIAIKYLCIVTYTFINIISLIAMFLIITSRLDKYINKKFFPSLYDKGINRK